VKPVPTPAPACQPCQERWTRYREAITNGFGKEEQEHQTYELPQVYSTPNPLAWR
jgi:hypothetical protein